MLSRQFIRSAQSHVRWFTRSSIARESQNEAQKGDGIIGSRMHRVSNFDKRVLVWVKRYASIADVPKDVSVECILAARSKARIKACNYMIAVTVLGCIISVMIGKSKASKGETWAKEREDWYQENVEKHKNK